MYTLVLALVLMGGKYSAPNSAAVTHISGFRTKTDCKAALSKEEKALNVNVGSQSFGAPAAYLSVLGSCVKVPGAGR